MPGVLPFVGPGLDILGSVTGGKKQQNAMNQQSAASQAAAQAMSQLINQAILPGFNTEMQSYQQNFAPIQQGVSSAYGSLLPQLNLGGSYAGMESALGGLQNLGQSTIGGLGGLQGVTQNAYDVLNQQAGRAMHLYDQTAKHGYSPQVISSAYNNLGVQNAQQMNQITNQLGDALPNLAGTIKDMQLNDAMSRAQLGSQLAAGDQALKLQGAGLATGLGQQIGQDVMQQVPQIASLMGQQFGIGQDIFNANQQMFNTGMGAAGQMGNYANQGQDMLNQALSGLMSIAGMYGNMASGSASNMMNMMNNGGGFGGAMSSIGNILSNLPGMSGAGTYSPFSMPSNLFPSLPGYAPLPGMESFPGMGTAYGAGPMAGFPGMGPFVGP